jgi:hypothetical protein
MNANSTPTPMSGTELTTSALFDDLRDCKSFNLREVGRGGGGRILAYSTKPHGSAALQPPLPDNRYKQYKTT